MFNSGILDVALGLIFVYLLLSLICTAVNEAIEARLKMRASDLEQGLREMLNDPEGDGLVAQLYQHPLIMGLYQGTYNAGATPNNTGATPDNNGRRDTSNLPSYIPRRNFALALLDIVRSASATTGVTSGATSGAAGSTVRTVDRATTPAGQTMAELRTSIEAIQNPNVRSALLVLVDSAGNDLTRARENIEDWFDSTMDRVSGWYKRRSQQIILVLGLVTAVIVNADTVTIATSLSSDVSTRESLVAAATEYAKPVTPAPSPTPEKDSAIPACTVDINSPECRIGKNAAQIQKLGLPVGWGPNDPRLVPNNPLGWAMKVLGWLLTAMAISLGAPFWFDMLNKIIVVRSTVKPKEKSPDEPPVDRR